MLALGHPEWSAYAASGAFAVYGRNHVHLSRATTQLSAGTLLVAAVVACVLVGILLVVAMELVRRRARG